MVIGRWTFARGGMLAATALAVAGPSSGCGGGAVAGKPSDGGTRDATNRDGSFKDTKADAPQRGDSRPTGTLPVGHSCSAGGDCLSGFCADGFCCATDCSAACQTCAATGHIGSCIPADVETDPRNDCPDTGAATCGTDGFCDGAGACEKYVAAVACQKAGCTGSSLTFAGRCDGLGTCVTTPAQSCAPFTCAASGQCKTTCTADTDCATGATCMNGSCGKKPIGASCGVDTDCNSGICAQGTCCMTACTGLCRSCGISGSAGVCTSVPAGQDPLDQCADNGAASCGTDGFCDGDGACQSYSSTTSCGMDSCTGGTETPAARCDGVGDCVSVTPAGCAPYVCGAGGDCKTSCATDADCVSPNVCTAGVCVAGCPGVYCDNFEADTVGAMAIGWTREGGSSGDWQVISDATKAFAQNHAQSATFRLAYASGAAGAPWSGATTLTASVKVLAIGTSGTTTAFVCLRYTGGTAGDYACLALEPGTGAQIKMRNGGTVTSGPLWTPTLAVGTWYTAVLSASASGALSASINGTSLGTFTPTTAVPSGFVAVATQSAEAAFDNLVVTQP